MTTYVNPGFAFVRRTGGRPLAPLADGDMDFIGATGKLKVPATLKSGWSAPSSGAAKLIPVFAGVHASTGVHQLGYVKARPGEIPIYGARRVFNEADPVRLDPVTGLINKMESGGGTAVITRNAGLNPDGSQGAIRVQATRPNTAAYCGLSFPINSPLVPYTRIISTYWLRSYDGTSYSVHITAGGSGQGARVTVDGTWRRFCVAGLAASDGSCYLQVLSYLATASDTIDVLLATDTSHCHVSVGAFAQPAVAEMDAPEQVHPLTDYGFGAPGVLYSHETSGLKFNSATGVISAAPKIGIKSIKGFRVLPALTNRCDRSIPLLTRPVDNGSLVAAPNVAGICCESPVKLITSGGPDINYTRFIHPQSGGPPALNSWQCAAVVVRQAEISALLLNMFAGGTAGHQSQIIFNLKTKHISSAGSYPQNDLSNAKLVDLGGGYFLCMVKAKHNDAVQAGGSFMNLYVNMDFTNEPTLKGDGTSGFHLHHVGVYDLGQFTDPAGGSAFLDAEALIQTSGASAARVADVARFSITPDPVPEISFALDIEMTENINNLETGRGRSFAIGDARLTYASAGYSHRDIGPTGVNPATGGRFYHTFDKGLRKYVYAIGGENLNTDLEEVADNVAVRKTLATNLPFTSGTVVSIGHSSFQCLPGYIRRFRYWFKRLRSEHLLELGK